MPIEAGTTVSDYEVLELLGKGGMGRVYRVRNIISHRIEAMKVLLDNLAFDPDLADRFMSEIRILARLDHPNIAKLHTAITIDNQLVMIMELLEGSTLSERIKQGPLPLNDTIAFTSQTLSALAYAHQAGVIHRDVKPSNIMITAHGVVKLMDFGIAKADSEHSQTRTGMTMGSMLYMSPEQVRGSNVDARSDIYSVGVMLYELTTGRRPFDGDNTHAILDAQLNQPPRPPAELNPATPPALNEMILMAMAKEPMRRFQSADAFRKALESLTPRPAAAPQPVVLPATALQPKSSRGLWMALGAVACVGVLVGSAVLLPHFFKSHASSPRLESPASPRLESPAPQISPAPPPSAPPQTKPPIVDVAPLPPPDDVPRKAETDKVVYPVRQRLETKLEQNAVQPSEPPAQQAQAPPVPAGPSPEQMDAASEELMKLNSRADAVRGSLDRLRSQQAADGLGLNPTVVAGAGRMDNYLRAAGQQLQSGNLEGAQKSLDRANLEITKLESFFGR